MAGCGLWLAPQLAGDRYNLINIGAFVAFALDPSNRYLQFSIYCVVCVSVVLGALLFRFGIPAHNVKQNDEFVKNMKEVCTWVPKIKFNAAALNIDMFAVAMFSGIMMYATPQRTCAARWCTHLCDFAGTSGTMMKSHYSVPTPT